jgi:hypothetical protein
LYSVIRTKNAEIACIINTSQLSSELLSELFINAQTYIEKSNAIITVQSIDIDSETAVDACNNLIIACMNNIILQTNKIFSSLIKKYINETIQISDVINGVHNQIEQYKKINNITLSFLINKIASAFCSKYTSEIYNLKAIDDILISKLRLDIKPLEEYFLNKNAEIDKNFNHKKIIQQEFAYVTSILKVLQTTQTESYFIDNYCTLVCEQYRSQDDCISLFKLKSMNRNYLDTLKLELIKRNIPKTSNKDIMRFEEKMHKRTTLIDILAKII